VFGTHANGATLLLYEGSPDRPDNGRLWRLVEHHRVTMLGVSPTLVRALKSTELGHIRSTDLSSVHVLGSTGEPWDPESYEWLARDVFGGRLPVINFSGGTEVGGSFLAPYPVESIRSCSLGGPSLGMDVDVVDDTGRSVRGQVGELVCRQPWPSMTRGVWKDDERYIQAYWSRFPGIWTHGDFATAEAAVDLVRLADHPSLAIVWDAANTVAAGEEVATSAKLVAPHLALVHLRDAKAVAGKRFWQPVLAGRGSVPFEAVIGELRAIGYAGYVSFEWEKYWYPELEEPEVALADFRNAISRLAVAA